MEEKNYKTDINKVTANILDSFYTSKEVDTNIKFLVDPSYDQRKDEQLELHYSMIIKDISVIVRNDKYLMDIYSSLSKGLSRGKLKRINKNQINNIYEIIKVHLQDRYNVSEIICNVSEFFFTPIDVFYKKLYAIPFKQEIIEFYSKQLNKKGVINLF